MDGGPLHAVHASVTYPNPLLSLKACANSPPYTMSFLGTHPLSTHVPPAPPFLSEATRSNGISQTATLAPMTQATTSVDPAVAAALDLLCDRLACGSSQRLDYRHRQRELYHNFEQQSERP